MNSNDFQLRKLVRTISYLNSYDSTNPNRLLSYGDFQEYFTLQKVDLKRYLEFHFFTLRSSLPFDNF